MFRKITVITTIIFMGLTLVGCTFILQRARRSDVQRIEELSRTKSLLEQRLKDEIADKKVRLETLEKGLVISFVADILFDSGKAKIKPEAYAMLDKIARVLIENVPENFIGIEGHTDNQPIKYSRWKSNWELSTARALSVLHYLVDDKNIPPARIQASGFGEYRPLASNETKEGRQLNRRVEIVILPKLAREKTQESEPEPALKEPQEKRK